MLFVAPLSKEEIISLKEMTENHPLSWTRMRANAIILSTEAPRWRAWGRGKYTKNTVTTQPLYRGL